ncbi:PREDICTED: putative defense protein Hdd11 [Papilio polytes]|uniref:putative defense protein Hdd11 n=1 Tax=Papilio polytes TaxID=76194 RepID=UPI00067687D6|nr:PREDICTED: putative defense protein Hdd11 [Papilio polytes]
MTWFTYVAVAIAVLAYADGYSVGAPESACKDMIPRHPVPPQKTAPPYKITTSTKAVRAGTPIEVTIAGNNAKDTMRGILLQARKGDDIVGTFTLDPNDSFAQLLNCGAPGNAITHKKHDGNLDKQTATFTWTPSEDLDGEIKFRATIAYNGAVFWVGVESAPVTITH